jgi:hypothetical protein
LTTTSCRAWRQFPILALLTTGLWLSMDAPSDTQQAVQFTGTERFAPFEPGLAPHEARPIDLRSDGVLELVVAQLKPQSSAYHPLVLFQRDAGGDLSHADQSALTTPTPTQHPRHMLTADFNGDGRMDLLVADHGIDVSPFPGGQSRLVMQTSDGFLADETEARLPLMKAFTHHAAAGDIDGDGDVDIYMANIFNEARIGPRFYSNDGTGRFGQDDTRIPRAIRELERRYTASALVDIDRDGDLDLALGGHPAFSQSGRDALLLNDGRGFFVDAPATWMPITARDASWGTVAMAVEDINGDWWPDLLMAAQSGPGNAATIEVLLNSGAVSKNGVCDLQMQDVSSRVQQSWPANVWAMWIHPADFNLDNRVDFAVQVNQGAPRLFINQGDAHFADASAAIPTRADGTTIQHATIGVGDFDDDERPDMFLLFSNHQMLARNTTPLPSSVDTLQGTIVRAAHITDLRQRLSALRDRFALAPVEWVDPSLAAGTAVRGVHITQLRSAVSETAAAAAAIAPRFSDPVITPLVTPIRSRHVRELRDAIGALETWKLCRS